MKRKLSLILALVLMLSTLFSVNVFAATSSDVYSKLKSKLPIVTYAMPLSGENKVYAYKDSSLKTKENSYYISTFSDQIVITEISSNGKAVKVTYPSSSASSGYRTKWFKADDILGLTNVDVNSYTASKVSTTYRMKSKSATTSYGSIAKNDSCVRLGTHKIGSTTYYPTVYNISSTKVNKVSGIKNKLALATVKENKGITLNPTSLTIAKGKTETITATLINTGSNSISAKSSNTNIATVSISGKKVTVKGVKAGSATITVTSGSYSAKANVSVYAGSNKYISKLDGMIDGSLYDGVYKVGTKYTGPNASEQCKGFARTVHNKLFGYDIGSTQSKPNNYKINISTKNTKLIGSVTSKSENSDFKKLFLQGRAGDFVQMRRSHTGSHSAILYSANSDGVVFYEANLDGANGIVKKSYTWSQLNEKNEAMSLYTAKNY